MREIQSLARGVQIIDLLVNACRPFSITELAQELELDKSSVSRLVRTLENYGYVQKAQGSRCYTIGKRLFVIGLQLGNRHAIRETALPFLNELAEATGECAHIGVYSSGKALITDDVQPETSLLRVIGKSGRHIHLHNTAVGKGLVAHGDFPLPIELPALTARTITTAHALQAELKHVRECGYALDDEENEHGVRCIASPVFDMVGVTVASIGISGPTVRMTDDRIPQLAKVVKDIARRLSQELGYKGQ